MITTSTEIYKSISNAMDNGKESIIEFFKSHNLTEMEFLPNYDFDMEDEEFEEYENKLLLCQVYGLGHARKWIELISITKLELRQDGDSVEFYCYGEQECDEFEGEDVELIPESYPEILEFLETVEPYLEYYK